MSISKWFKFLLVASFCSVFFGCTNSPRSAVNDSGNSEAPVSPSHPPSAFPDATSTGYLPTGQMLQPLYSGVMEITSPGTYTGLNIRGVLYITADNVTIKNSRIASDGSWVVVDIPNPQTNVVIEDTEIIGAGVAGDIVGQDGFSLAGGVTILRCNVHEVGSGIYVGTGPLLVQDSYFHDFNGNSATHYNGIMDNGGSSLPIDIEHNSIINQQSQTDAIMLDNWQGSISNVTVNNNLLTGGSYTVYVDDSLGSTPIDSSTIKITNNRIGGATYGYFDFNGTNPVVSGNVDNSTNQPLN